MQKYLMGCPHCSAFNGLNAAVVEFEGKLKCTYDGTHKFELDSNGFLKSV